VSRTEREKGEKKGKREKQITQRRFENRVSRFHKAELPLHQGLLCTYIHVSAPIHGRDELILELLDMEKGGSLVGSVGDEVD
jgi:hypothetical protein